MIQNRQSKVVAIIALCLSVVGLTLGFAAFSNTLTISSSATVSPAASDFKMVMYGLTNADDYKSDIEVGSSYYTSTTSTVPMLNVDTTAPNAELDNETLTIKNISPTFKAPGSGVNYSIKIVNEGKYTAYISADEVFALQEKIASERQCIPAAGTTAEYVDSACQDIEFAVYIYHRDGNQNLESNIPLAEIDYMTIEPNDYVELLIDITYWHSANALLADGDFNIKFPDLKLNFSTVKPEA